MLVEDVRAGFDANGGTAMHRHRSAVESIFNRCLLRRGTMDDMTHDEAAPQQQQPQRILARAVARELTLDELDEVSGGLMAGYTATSCNCDCDACDA